MRGKNRDTRKPVSSGKAANSGDDTEARSQESQAGLALQREIIREMGSKARQMWEDARDNPNSEASEMVHILLFTQLVNMEEQLPEKDLKQLYGEQFRRHRLQKDLEIAKYNAKRADERIRQADDRNAMLERKLKIAEDEAKEKQKRLDQAEREANKARAALENQQPIDHMAIYNKIAEVIGIRPPASQQLEQ